MFEIALRMSVPAIHMALIMFVVYQRRTSTRSSICIAWRGQINHVCDLRFGVNTMGAFYWPVRTDEIIWTDMLPQPEEQQ